MMNAKRVATVLGAALAVPALATASSVSASASEPAPPAPPGAVTMQVETVNGSGCVAGSATVTPSHDNTAFTITYQDYVAFAGPQAPPTAFRKNCQLNLTVNAPDGWTYAITGIEHRGYAHLEAGATGLKRANYYFQGDSKSRSVSRTFEGPYDDNWRLVDKIDPADLIYKPCEADRNLNINTELRVTAGDSGKSSFMAMESNYGDSLYHIAWKRC